MSLEQLWAGWRAGYVASVAEGAHPAADAGAAGIAGHEPGAAGAEAPAGEDGGPEHCVFCRIAAAREPGADEANFVLWRGRRVLAMLNAYPYASGHLMVMPARHVGELELLEADESTELWSATQAGVRALKAAYAPDGLNLGLNLGRAAGAGIPAHLHVHAVPRWGGDTNFMTSVASLRVLPEAITESWSKLRRAWPR
jgi:ATP adenylyltransferase